MGKSENGDSTDQENEKLQENKNNNADYEVKKADQDDEARETWGGKLDFLMSALSFAVGMGNMWRFPYLCYRNGGGAFLVPYVLMMVIIGIPMVFLEFAFGQFGRSGIVSIWKCCPLFQGVGWGMFLLSLFTSFYYNMLNAWCLFYIGASFAKDVPWRNCGNSWNVNCGQPEVLVMQKNCTNNNGTFFNGTCFSVSEHGSAVYSSMAALVGNTSNHVKSPSDEYFHNYMLEISSGITDAGQMSWKLVLCLFFAWLIVGVCLIKGIQTSGKATYVTALFPYVVLVILFVRGITLDGSSEGILYYLTPQWHRLKSPKVWVDAGVQVFFSLSVSWGGLITLSSYNNFHNNCMRDAIIVASGDCLTSIFGGVVVFAFIGYMANTMMVPIPEVATQGAGLAFTVYPQAVTTLPVSQLWSVLFFVMLINVGIGTQFALTQTIQATLVDQFPDFFKKGHRSVILLAVICVSCFLVGLSICTNGGIYVLQLLDNYTASYSLLIFGFTMCIALPWVYGSDKFSSDIQRMIGKKPSIYWIICWKFISPACIVALLIFTLLDFKRTTYGNYVLPVWADVVGFMFTLVEILAIPALIIWNYFHVEGKTFMERCRKLVTPSLDWGVHNNVEKKDEEGTEMLPVTNSENPQV